MAAGISDNGLKRFSFHASEDTAAAAAMRPAVDKAVAAFAPLMGLAPEGGGPAGGTGRAGSGSGGRGRRATAPNTPAATVAANTGLAALDPESAARLYLGGAIGGGFIEPVTPADPDGQRSELKSLGTEFVPALGTRIVKFRQYSRKIPVYGSLATVELDANNELLSINSGLGEPSNVDPVARVSPAEALDVVRHEAGWGRRPLDAVPRLLFYYDRDAARWRLAYMVENVAKLAAAGSATAPRLRRLAGLSIQGGYNGPRLHRDAGGTVSPLGPADKPAMTAAEPEPTLIADYVIDAHTGDLVAELPRTQGMAAVQVDAADALGRARHITVDADGNGARVLYDSVLNVRTHTFNFRDAWFDRASLPGPAVVPGPDGDWDPGAVSAHANAAEVARFLRDAFGRNGLDNLGGTIVSTVNCIYNSRQPETREWRNAAWSGGQMLYGQRLVGGHLRTYALAKDVVAHELTHGLTEATCRLEYRGQTGALNESYSDIFGVIITNFDRPSAADWDWEIGEDLSGTGVPLRNLSRPGLYGQPEHMSQYRDLPADAVNDWGGVHANSGIHNKAAYNLLTARDAAGQPYFDPRVVAAFFYVALTQYLSRTSGFGDSRRAVELAARTWLRTDANAQQKLAAVGRAFEDVGITGPN